MSHTHGHRLTTPCIVFILLKFVDDVLLDFAVYVNWMCFPYMTESVLLWYVWAPWHQYSQYMHWSIQANTEVSKTNGHTGANFMTEIAVHRSHVQTHFMTSGLLYRHIHFVSLWRWLNRPSCNEWLTLRSAFAELPREFSVLLSLLPFLLPPSPSFIPFPPLLPSSPSFLSIRDSTAEAVQC